MPLCDYRLIHSTFIAQIPVVSPPFLFGPFPVYSASYPFGPLVYTSHQVISWVACVTWHLSNQYQSAYKNFHSTETALLRVENDIILNMDEGRVAALTLLDLSAAFDTLDHNSITNLLSTWYGVDGIVLDWFVSYLSDRKQKVKLW